MLEILLGEKRKKTSVSKIRDFTIYVLSPSLFNTDGTPQAWFGLYYIELLDKDGQPIAGYNTSSVTASSQYGGATYTPSQAVIRNTAGYWCNSSSNTGNPNKSLWIKVVLANELEISGFRLCLVTSYSSRTFLIESTNGLSLNAFSGSNPVWPVRNVTGIGSVPVVEMKI